MAPWRVAGINFDHMHMGDLLLYVSQHPNAEIVGVCDKDVDRMKGAIERFSIESDSVFANVDECIQKTKPDLVILCAATADHATAVEQVAKHGVHILVEKPFAANLADADRMMQAMSRTGRLLAINWPLRWVASHVTAKRLIDDGTIGDVREIHHYGGNRGPLYHLAEKVEVVEEDVQRAKPTSWWYKAASGGGSLLDYLGYGATLGTWYMDGRSPITVTTVCSSSNPEIEVDEHSITICRYDTGLSRMETRWGTFTDPWTTQPQPKCGFVLVGTAGTISTYDYESYVGVQTRERRQITRVPVDTLNFPERNPVEYVLHRIETGGKVEGPLDPALCRIGQQIIDTAVESARQQKTIALLV